MSAATDVLATAAGLVGIVSQMVPPHDEENLQRLYRIQREMSDVAMALQAAAGGSHATEKPGDGT